MLKDLDKLVLAGLGALSMTREKAEKLFGEYVRRGRTVKVGRAGFVKNMVNSADKAKSKLEQLVSQQVRKALTKLDVPTRKDLARLEAKIESLKGGKR